jgi:hypothetical protein
MTSCCAWPQFGQVSTDSRITVLTRGRFPRGKSSSIAAYGPHPSTIAAEKQLADVNDLASVVLTFFTGLSVEQNLKPSRAATVRKGASLMRVLRSL